MEALMTRIGERIRDLRQKREMTQKELAGSYMTRNMLSLIENGQAAPSLATILYIAGQLNVPAGYFFMASAEEEKLYYKMMSLPEIKQLYRNGCFSECEQRIQEIPVDCMDDEMAFIAAQCFFRTAMEHASSYALRMADSHLHMAEEALNGTVYAGNDLKAAVLYYRELISRLISAAPLTDKLTNLSNASSLVPVDMLRYFEEIKNDSVHSPHTERVWNPNSYHDKHLYGLFLIASGQKKLAVSVLQNLLEDDALPFYMRYRVCSDLEEAANAYGDFRSAYAAARKKLDLMEIAKI